MSQFLRQEQVRIMTSISVRRKPFSGCLQLRHLQQRCYSENKCNSQIPTFFWKHHHHHQKDAPHPTFIVQQMDRYCCSDVSSKKIGYLKISRVHIDKKLRDWCGRESHHEESKLTFVSCIVDLCLCPRLYCWILVWLQHYIILATKGLKYENKEMTISFATVDKQVEL